MRIFVAGANGALGRRLVSLLVGRGHQVVGSTRHESTTAAVSACGAEPVVLDALDRRQVETVVGRAAPEVVVHQLTALSGAFDLNKLDRFFTMTNRLRTEALEHLLAAAQAAGSRRIVAQSYTGWPNERTGGLVKTESDPLDPDPPAAARQSLAAIRHVDEVMSAARDIEGVALRYGSFYGPGNAIGRGGAMVEMVRKRQFPVVGGGTGVWSLVHIDDAAMATALAIEGRGAPGLYNVVDDEPAAVRDWLPYLAEVIGAKPPWRVPGWLVRPMLGENGISWMTSIRGSSNAKARRELGWEPTYSSWRQGFREGLG